MNQAFKPTVCHVLHSLEFGGAEMLARRFAMGLQSEFRPVFACLDSLGPLGEQLRRDGVPVCVLERRAGLDVRCISRLGRWLGEQKVDLIHAHQYAPFFYSSLSRWRSRRIPILFTEHGRDFPDYRRWKRIIANRLLLRRTDHVVAVGGQVRQALIDNEGLPPERIQIIHNGVDAKPLECSPSVRAAVRSELGYSDDNFVIIQVARLNRLKDHATAVRAMARLKESSQNVRLLLVGDGEARGSIEKLVESLGLSELVRLLGTRADVPRLLQASDVFLLTSISEGIPLTLVEAMLARLPIVATRVGGVPEVVVDGQSGLLAEPGDVFGVAMRIERIIRDPHLRHGLVETGFRRACEKFNAEKMLGTYLRAYKSLLLRLSVASHRVAESNVGGISVEMTASLNTTFVGRE